MGKELYETNATARAFFDQANSVLGFDITAIMFSGTADELKQTRVTQPAIFIHSVATALSGKEFKPSMVAGHSLGEFSALVASKALTYEDGLRLVARRAEAMQRACDMNPSSMAAVLGLDDKVDRKSTRLNSSHVKISYAVFCLKKKKTKSHHTDD